MTLAIKKRQEAIKLIESLQNLSPFNTQSLTTKNSTQDEIEFSNKILAQNCHFVKIKEIGFTKDMPRRESLENVIAVMNNPEFNFVYFLSGNNDGVELYLGVTRDYHYAKPSKLHAYDFGELLRESFAGNFHGSTLEDITTDVELNKTILSSLAKSRRGSVITGIPSINEHAEEKDLYTQKLDGLVNSMNGTVGDWQLLIVCDAMPQEEINALKESLYQIYDKVHLSSKTTVQLSLGSNESSSATLGSGTNKGTNIGTNSSASKGQSSSSSSSDNSSNHSKGKSDGASKGSNTSQSKTQSMGTTTGEANTTEHIRKEHQALLKYMDEELLDRINIGAIKGLFKTSIYALAENNLTHQRLVRNICSMWQGDCSSMSPLRATELPKGVTGDLHKILAHFQSLELQKILGDNVPLVLGHPKSKYSFELRTCLTSRELSLICSLPAKDVSGLPLREGVDFGLNPKEVNQSDAIELGTIMHQGTELKNRPVRINKEMLSRHVFIAGVTGSGKTTTCRRLLTESELPFLIIEPAKTEYRSLLNEIDDMQIYTLGNENYAPFRFNPFELLPGESITSHVDLLKAAFTAAFPMEAAMPYLLEEAIYECYTDYGWNTDGWFDVADANIYCENPWQEAGLYWPTLNDLLKNVDRVVKSKNFDTRLESDYTASLVARFKNLTVGSKGQMLNCRVSSDINQLLNKKVVLELDDLKSQEDKCLMMGLIIARFSEAIKLRFIAQPDYKHITLIEEAHRLLEKPSPGDDGSRKHAVGMFTDLLAEVRKYGESLVIVDQIPNKLAPEVLKNTNTKIIHKLFARDDREVIGDTVGLDETQKGFLTDLRIGEVIVYCGDWKKAIHAKIRQATTDNQKTDAELIQQVSAIGKAQMLVYQQQYFPELVISKQTLDEKLLMSYSRNKKRFWKTLSTVIDKAIRESVCQSSPGNIKNDAMDKLSSLFYLISSAVVNCEVSNQLISNDIISRLPFDIALDESQSYEKIIAELFFENSKPNVDELFKQHREELRDLLNYIY